VSRRLTRACSRREFGLNKGQPPVQHPKPDEIEKFDTLTRPTFEIPKLPNPSPSSHARICTSQSHLHSKRHTGD